MNEKTTGKVYFIGAGPGDPDLITIKGQKLLANADLVLYAGSLVPTEMLKHTRAGIELYNSAGMKLEQQMGLMVNAVQQGKRVVRLHTGDPSIFGAIDEQMQSLERAGIEYEIIPGVSSAFAAAAALGIEYTLPEITQTLILTRTDGRTSVPEPERLRELARHHSSLVIFLSTGMITRVVDELMAAGYPEETPIAIVYRASWPDQKVVRGTLADIQFKIEQEELTHQGIIIISPSLSPERISSSHLYNGFQNVVSERNGLAILALTKPAVNLGRNLKSHFSSAHLFIPEPLLGDDEYPNPNIHGFHESIRQVLHEAFSHYQALVCIMASGIVVRELAPLLKNKHSDPAVIVMDHNGKFVVSLLGGHEGGANRLASRIAAITGGQAVITTASDNRDIPAIDTLAKEQGWKLDPRSRLAKVMAALVNEDPVGLVRGEGNFLPEEVLAFPWAGEYFNWKEAASLHRQLVVYTCQMLPEPFWQAVPEAAVYYLPALVVGIGCNRSTPYAEILMAIRETLEKAGLAIQSVACVATITEKADESGLIEACRSMGWKMRVFSHEQIQEVRDIPNPSEIVWSTLGVSGVAEPAALLASGATALLVEKQKYTNVTIAVALRAEAG